MNKRDYITKLQETTNLDEAYAIMDKLGSGSATHKVMETAISLGQSTDPQQRGLASGFRKSAIQEEEKRLDDEDLKIKEEELDNHNNGGREEGSEQSSDNTEPYGQEGSKKPDGGTDMEGATGTENQMKEQMPGQPGGQMPPMPGMMPGLAPDVANEMGAGMPQLPPMNTNQQMRQMQYTVQSQMKPVFNQMKQMQEAIKKLSKQVRETQAPKSIELDLGLKKSKPVQVRETQPKKSSYYDKNNIKRDIAAMDRS